MSALTVIIPTLNEAEYIRQTIDTVRNHASSPVDIVVVDGGSTDNTIALARNLNVCVMTAPTGNRATQMNLGAEAATSDALFFLHADTLVPVDFDREILQYTSDDLAYGQFCLDFIDGPWPLKYHARSSRKKSAFCGGGDQGLFITRTLFDRVGGFNPAFQVMEDYDLYDRAKKITTPALINSAVTTSGRKYKQSNYLKIQLYNLVMMMVYKMTHNPSILNVLSGRMG